MSTLIYGKVTHTRLSFPFQRDRVIYLNNELAVSARVGSLQERSVNRGDFGYFVFDKDYKLTDFYKPVFNDSYMEGKISHHEQCLKASTTRMINAYDALTANDKAIVANAIAMTVSGGLCVASVIGTVVSIFSGDFTGILGGAAASAVTGAYAYIAYDSMSKAMQNAYDCSEAFAKALSAYHTFTTQNVPEHMRELPVYNPQFSEFTKLVRKIFPHMTEEQFMANDLNWSVA